MNMHVGLENSLKPKRVAVVGAGPGGLASAMMLAAAGLDVTVYEKADRVGGRTRTIEAEQFRFDIGPTFFLYPEILQSLFHRCGLDLADFVTLKRLDPHYRLKFEDGPDLVTTSDLDRLEVEIAKIDAEDAKNIRRFIARGRAKLEAFRPVLQKAFLSPLDLLSPDVLKSLGLLAPFSSVDGDLSKLFKDPRIRLAFSFQTKYLGMSPFRCPSLFTILSFLEYEFGVWHPMGGCGTLSEGMATAASRLGVKFRLGEEVRSIDFEGKVATGIVTANGREACDAVVVNGDFAHAIPRLIPARLRRRWSDKRIDKAQYSCSTFMLYLGIEGRYDHLDHHTIFLAKDYRRNIEEIEAAEKPPEQPSIYVQNPVRSDPAFGGDDYSSLYVLVPVGHCGKVDWAAEGGAFRDMVLERLEGLGLTDLRSRIRFEKVVTPDQWRDDLSIYRGATFNLAHSLDQMLLFRPHNKFDGVDGVYLVGGGTHPGSGLPVIYEGARITSDLVLSDLGQADRIPTVTANDMPLVASSQA
ncbi:phytoene desaturase family protein [Lichenihabitans psoromatis]|uniref:phytoene desaturase family protein n=1 Tax=Lichenihabitans psoromatis TaxID=2528642 RepID=UPI001A94C773|nr:phytoene desaturase family protein [Lichenihabitans psoromatis]